ncbi:type I-E CRISPR-associated protein Cse1/CasA [Streptosporangium roseum]|uniref:type I-E CRISPR-associated protein Cse1/CasA n=1 Tax=Streptosporangium roseum TaxID=2001 RepID=UPI000AF6DBDA|nr:type I-E CRISPR-associated protein Cse1/CasA [Streptosporangium roseum]
MTYDLLTRKWLSVRKGDSRREIGLRELFECAHELTDIEASPPPGASGLWRVLTVIAARMTGLDDMTLSAYEWGERQSEVLEAGQFDQVEVEKYFARYPGRFDLFDAHRPWLQDPRLREECKGSSGVNKLVMSRPAGNNQVWFNHATALDPPPVPAGEAVFHLLTQLYYGPSGQCTPRVVAGTSGGNSKAGPLRRTISFHPLGRTVFESLIAGIPPAYLYDTGGVDLAPWEADELPDPLGVPPRPSGLGGVLTGRFQHAVLLERSADEGSVVDAWITWAWRDKEFPADDPYLVYQQNKEGAFYARQADASRALWRDFDSLLLEDVGDEHRRRPAVLAAVEDLRGTLLPVLRARAFGFDQDGQTRDKEWTVGVTPALLTLANEIQVARAISDMRQAAERVQRYLEWALRDAWIAINDPSNGNGKPQRKDISKGPWPAQGSFRYWARAERIFWRRVRERRFDSAMDDFLHLALDVYDEVTDSGGPLPRVKRAVELKRGLIFGARPSTGKAGKTSKAKERV